MSVAETRAVRIVRALGLEASTTAGDNDAHRQGGPPPSYGLQEITGGKARAIALNLPVEGFPKRRRPSGQPMMETGWHYHNIDLQLAFISSGAIDIAYADGQWRRYEAGEILVIPGGVPHNAANASEDYGLVEFTLPGDFGTIPCPPHPMDEPVMGFVLDDSQVRPNPIDGVAEYVLAPHVARVADLRLLKAGEGAVETPPGGLCFTLLTHGRCEIDAEGSRETLGPWDMAIDDAKHGRGRLLSRSPDFRAYQVQLRT